MSDASQQFNVENGSQFNSSKPPKHADVCVIGTGPAGVTAALELSRAGKDVILLDGSRELDYGSSQYYLQSWPDKTLLYNGLADGAFANNEPQFLIRGNDEFPSFPTERERVYGGTSTHWGGQSRPLDPIVFEKRAGFPGWPITRQDLDPYYAKSSVLNNLVGDYGEDGTNFTAGFWVEQLESQSVAGSVPNLDNFNAEMYQFMGGPLLNFATRTFDGKRIDQTSVRVIVNATVLGIVEQNGSVQSLNVASMTDATPPQKDTEFTVSADAYILACGAVANPRQLLLSAIGNDLVGRYFMCHPLSRNGIIQTRETYLSTGENNLMNGGNSQWNAPPNTINGFTGRFTATAEAARAHEIGRCWFWANSAGNGNQMYFEMTPNYHSYVSLNDTTDPVFGQQQTNIHWQFSDRDRRTYETNCRLFAEASSEQSQIISWPPWSQVVDELVVNGHHIGTTRMSASTAPDAGVVDENLKIHDVDNLFVAGSSVFPSTGVSNPTMTIIALSIRLAEHVASQV